MDRLTDFLGAHWLAVALLVAAAALLVRVLRRHPIPWGTATAAFACALLGIGGLALTGIPAEVLGYPFSIAELLIGTAFVGFVLAAAVLIITRAWSFYLGVVLTALALLGVGAAIIHDAGTGLADAVTSLAGLEFVRPEWLALLVVVPFVFLVSRRSLSGLGTTRKWLAISARALGITFLALALAEPRIRRSSEHVTVLFVVDKSFSVPQDLDPNRSTTDAEDRRWSRVREFIGEAVARRGPAHREDQVGLLMFGKRPKLVLPPAPVDHLPINDRLAGSIDGNYTDIGAALKLALASFPEGTGRRIVLFSDGNENIGSAEEQAALAKQNGVEIDAVALAPGYHNESEVLVQAVEAPPVTNLGQRLPVRVLVRNATPNRLVEGRLEVIKTGDNKPIEVEDSPQVLEEGPPPKVQLLPGLNVFRFRDRIDPQGDSAFAYRATFTPTRSLPVGGGVVAGGLPGDRTANNRAATAVVSRGQRRVLLLDEPTADGSSPHDFLIRTLIREKIDCRRLPADRLPTEKGDLGVFLSNYDAIILANVPAERFTQDQMEVIRSSVFDQGCGLVMVGGPDSFGPGGYQQTPIEAALPVDCEIKALKAAGKGGLVLIMHASEMADGNKWQKDIAKLAIQRLGPADMVGVTQFGGFGAVSWVVPFQEVGEDRNRLLAKIDGMMPGDMPDFDPFLRAAADTLADKQYDLAVKHTIIISDGDPILNAPGIRALADMAANAITCTTVGVATHGVNEDGKMKKIAESTKDGSGKPGNFYKVADPNQLPAIYIKESRRVSQSFIFDKKFDPKLVVAGGPTEGIGGDLPDLHGFVRTTKKANPLVEMQIEGPTPYPDQQFPVLASWRYGLGKAIAFTSDARTQPGARAQWWDRDWVASDMYRNFWRQTVHWVMREAERGKLTLVTEYRDGRVRVTADLRDEKDKPVIGMILRGAVTPPGQEPGLGGSKPPTIEFKSKGAGLYEAEFPAEEAGSYFLNVQALEPERDAAGAVKIDPATGKAVMGVYDAARAGVTVPYSPEFADLESNTPLMRQLAQITGGQFHTEDDLTKWLATGDVFRPAPETVKAILPFWFWLVFTASLLLLFDVAIRRIALEWVEVRTAGLRFWRALRASEPWAAEGGALDRLQRRKVAVDETLARARAERRFDSTGAPPSDPAPAGADEYAARTPTGPPPNLPVARRTEDAPPEEDDAFSRLQKAKKRARHQRDKRDDETENR